MTAPKLHRHCLTGADLPGSAVTTQGANHELIQDDPGPLGPGRRAGDRVPRMAGTTAAATPGQEAAKAPAIQAGAPARGVRRHARRASAATRTCNAALTTGAHSHAFRAGTPMSPKGCQACHADTKATMGCEGCHGPGKDARRGGRGQDEDPPLRGDVARRTRARPASSCHFRTEHTFWAGSQHDQRNVGCTTLPQHPQRRGREAAQGGERDRSCARSATARS